MRNNNVAIPLWRYSLVSLLVVTSYVLLLLMSTASIAFSQEADQSESPYFYVTSGGDKVEDFPLLSTTAEVNIVGPIADVTVTQKYKNDGALPIEAVYVFPGSTRAAVYEMTMKIGDRIIKADIQEKKQARKTYEKAKSEGKRASLLEQHRPNVFQMNVANICPGDVIEVEMKYNEFLVPEEKVYSFVYPTVVGPRFTGSNEKDKGNTFPAIPYLKSGVKSESTFDIAVNVNAGMQLKETKSPTHKINVEHPTANTATVTLHRKEKNPGNRDFIFSYSLAGGKIAQGTMLYNHGDEHFFLTVLEPPARVDEVSIPPREYVFVVDVSGSMNGFPLDISKQLMKNLIYKMRPIDKFNVMLFASSSSVLAASSIVANAENLEKAYKFIDNQQGGGGTRLLPALRKALDLPTDNEINSRSIVVVTDGYVSVERETFKLISENLNKSNLFAFGIGSSVNRHLIEGMAYAGRGEAFVITDKKYAKKQAEKFRKYIQYPLLTNISYAFEGFDAYDVIPKTLPDLMAERPLYLFGKYRGEAKGKIKIKGFNGKEVFDGSVPLSSSMVSADNSPIRYLWAREKIRWVDDLNGLSKSEKETKAKVTALVSGTVPEDVKVTLRRMIQDQVSFTPEEKAFLNGNTLTLTYDNETHSWSVVDERGVLTEAFRQQFVYLMNSIYMPRLQGDKITVSLIWI